MFNFLLTAVPDLETSSNIGSILSNLFTSPVQRMLQSYESSISSVHQFMSYLNWFVPIGWMLDVLVAWLAAIGAFYAIMAVLRALKVVGS